MENYFAVSCICDMKADSCLQMHLLNDLLKNSKCISNLIRHFVTYISWKWASIIKTVKTSTSLTLCCIDAVRTPNLEDNQPTSGPSLSSFQHATTTVTMATRHPAHKSRSGLEEMESEGQMSFIAYWQLFFLKISTIRERKSYDSSLIIPFWFTLIFTEEPDEDEDDENSEESVEEESEEDLTDTPKTTSTQPPYSLIPPPPVWVQRNQGLSMRESMKHKQQIHL